MNRPKRFATYAVVLAYCAVLAAPLSSRVLAEEAQPEATQTETSQTPEQTPSETPATPPVTPPTPGPQQPTGPEKSTYIFNPETGLWENDYYTWDPVTKKTAPKNSVNYSFNPETGRWDNTEYVYVPEKGKYVPRSTIVVKPADNSDSTEQTSGQNTTQSPAQNSTSQPAAKPGTLSVDQPKLNNSNSPTSSPKLSVTNKSGSDSYFDLFFDATISTTIDSTAVSGDASVIQNTNGGSATTGDATAMANVVNLLQSTWGIDNSNLYTADIQGDYFGDIVIDPSLFTGVTSGGCGCGDLTVNASVNGQIKNDVDLVAKSGDATVNGNTNAGNATTGDASVLANVINMINSSINSGSSFMGVLNINGNFEGDVLLADNVVDQLIAANVPTTQVSLCNCGDLDIDISDTQVIDNNITASATSGSANVSHNTSAGNATSGDADTNVTLFNMTGKNVVGKDAILVFVNVQGEWIGFITNAPEGSTAAALGSGLSENFSFGGGDTEYDVSTNLSIQNNINAYAQSGNADVSYNTTAGDATSGDASAHVNVANVTNSNFSLSGFFGIFLINVSKNWYGSYGTNTAYGNPKPITSNPKPSDDQGNPANHVLGGFTNRTGTTPTSSKPMTPVKPKVRVFKASFTEDSNGNTVLASATEAEPPAPSSQSSASTTADNNTANNNSSLVTISMLAVIALGYGLIVRGDSLKSLVLRNR